MPRTRLVVLAVLLLAALAVALLGGDRGGGAEPLRGAVVRVVDGDTLLVRLDDGGRRERVRLIGVDTPESVAPGRPVECWSRRASAFVRRVADGRRVVLRPGRERRDRYGRLLAYVRVAGAAEDLQVALLRDGHARPLPIRPNVDREDEFARLASAARLARRGLWGACPDAA